ncbi:transcriptional regulator [Staphylococcus gallinarum]|uniref:Transcriptional regulator n=1 Tax=Staphylococcus gallinarum TaxID=1293 RepID=A0A380FJV0_STAGA|nr:transcriptional regulator [Staphylococcus gallinarum]
MIWLLLVFYNSYKSENIKLPDEVKLVSFNDLEVIQYAVPSVSGVHIPVDEFGRTAVRMAEERINKTRKIAIHVCSGGAIK